MKTRKEQADESLRFLREYCGDPSKNGIQRRQQMDNWLQNATAAEVRKNWRKCWGNLPGFAK